MTHGSELSISVLKIIDHTKLVNGKPLERVYEGTVSELRSIMLSGVIAWVKENGMEGLDEKEALYWKDKFVQKSKDFDTINRIYRDLLVEGARKTSLERYRAKLRKK